MSHPLRCRPGRHVSVVVGAALVGLLLIGRCTSTSTSTPPSPTSTPLPAATSLPTATTTTTGSPVLVYFSKSPQSLTDPTAVFSVQRMAPTAAVATFTIQLLIAGPTLE